MPEDNLARIEDTVDRVRAVVVIGGSFVVAHYVFSDFAEFGNLIVASIAGLIGFGVTFGCLARFLKLKRT